MEGIRASKSKVTVIHRPLPEESNHDGNVYGGNIMRHMDAVGAIAAVRHCRSKFVTAAVEYMSFLAPIKPSDLMLFHASVNAVWNTSMEVGIRTEAEEPYTGETRHVCTCYLTFVGVDDDGKPTRLPPLIPETPEDHRRMADATRRMAFSRMEHGRNDKASPLPPLMIDSATYALCTLPPETTLAELSGIPSEAILSMTRSPDGFCVIVKDDVAKILATSKSHIQIDPGYACLRVDAAPESLHAEGVPSRLIPLLTSAKIPAYSIATQCGMCVLIHKNSLEKTIERLQAAGHAIVPQVG